MDWPEAVTESQSPKLLWRGRGEGPTVGALGAALPTRLLSPDSLFFLFCLQIERTGPRCPCPTAVFMAA